MLLKVELSFPPLQLEDCSGLLWWVEDWKGLRWKTGMLGSASLDCIVGEACSYCCFLAASNHFGAEEKMLGFCGFFVVGLQSNILYEPKQMLASSGLHLCKRADATSSLLATPSLRLKGQKKGAHCCRDFHTWNPTGVGRVLEGCAQRSHSCLILTFS